MGPGFTLCGITDGKRRRLVETTWSARVGRADRAAPTPLLTLCSPSGSMGKAKPGGDDGGSSAGDTSGGGDGDPLELCGSSNPSQALPPRQSPEYAVARAFAKAVKANPTGSQHFASSFGGVV